MQYQWGAKAGGWIIQVVTMRNSDKINLQWRRVTVVSDPDLLQASQSRMMCNSSPAIILNEIGSLLAKALDTRCSSRKEPSNSTA
jgi:hypothetical protein